MSMLLVETKLCLMDLIILLIHHIFHPGFPLQLYSKPDANFLLISESFFQIFSASPSFFFVDYFFFFCRFHSFFRGAIGGTAFFPIDAMTAVRPGVFLGHLNSGIFQDLRYSLLTALFSDVTIIKNDSSAYTSNTKSPPSLSFDLTAAAKVSYTFAFPRPPFSSHLTDPYFTSFSPHQHAFPSIISSFL